MSVWSIIAISLAAGVILVIGGSLVAYMSSLVKNAYQLKVELNAEIDEQLRKMEDEIDKKSKWIKRDLLEEIDKIRTALATENSRKYTEFTEQVMRKAAEVEEISRRERTELIKALENQRQAIALQDQKLKALRQELVRLNGGAALSSPVLQPQPETEEAAVPVRRVPVDPHSFQSLDLPSTAAS